MAVGDERKARLKGIFNITMTPFDMNGSIDFPVLAESLERMIELDFDGVLIGGIYGEFPAMTPDERAELFHRSIDIVAGRVPVLLCSASSDPRVVLDLTILANRLGGVPMVTAPFATEVNDDHIFEFFRAIAPAAPSGLVIYNAPGIGITLSARLIERLTEIDPIVGLKQGDLGPTVIDDLANRVGGKIQLFCASDLAFLGPILSGFDGISSTNSCVFPELIQATYRALVAGDAGAAMRLHRSWYPFRALARRLGQPQTVKAAMPSRGWNGGRVRPPLHPLTSDQVEEVARATDAVLATWSHSHEAHRTKHAVG